MWSSDMSEQNKGVKYHTNELEDNVAYDQVAILWWSEIRAPLIPPTEEREPEQLCTAHLRIIVKLVKRNPICAQSPGIRQSALKWPV